MEVFRAIIKRKSIRKFDTKKPVDDKIIGLLIYAATQAPSAGNTQEWVFIVVRDEERRKRIAKICYNQEFVGEAPVIIVVCGNEKKIELMYGERGKKMYLYQDTAAAIENLLLLATSLGLGSCWVGAFDEEELKEVLELPENIKPLAVIPIGYPAEDPKKPERRPIESVTFLEKYGRKFELKELGEVVSEIMGSMIRFPKKK